MRRAMQYQQPSRPILHREGRVIRRLAGDIKILPAGWRDTYHKAIRGEFPQGLIHKAGSVVSLPVGTSMGPGIAYERVTDHRRGDIARQLHRLRVDLKRRLRGRRKAWLQLKTAHESALLRRSLSIHRYVRYDYVHINIDRDLLRLVRGSLAGFASNCKAVAPDLLHLVKSGKPVNATGHMRSAAEIQNQFYCGRFRLDRSFVAASTGLGFQERLDRVMSGSTKDTWLGSRVDANAYPIYISVNSVVSVRPIGQFRRFKRTRRLTAKEVSDIKRKRGPLWRYAKAEIRTGMLRWLSEHPYPTASRLFRDELLKIEELEHQLRDLVSFQHACGISIVTSPPSGSGRHRTSEMQISTKFDFGGTSGDYSDAMKVLTVTHAGAAYGNTNDYSTPLPIKVSWDGGVSRATNIALMAQREGHEVQLQRVSALSSGGAWLNSSDDLQRQEVTFESHVEQTVANHEEVGLSSQVMTDGAVQVLVAQKVAATSDLQLNTTGNFQFSRSVAELKDLPQTCSQAYGFLAWATAHPGMTLTRVIPRSKWSSKGNALLTVADSSLLNAARAYLWWKFGVEPTVSDVNRVLADTRVVFSRLRNRLTSYLNLAGEVVSGLTARNGFCQPDDREIQDKVHTLYPLTGSTSPYQLSLKIPVFPTQYGAERGVGVNPPRIGSYVDLGDAVISSPLYDIGAGVPEPNLTFTGKLVDWDRILRTWMQSRQLLLGPEHINQIVDLVGRTHGAYWLRVISATSMVSRGSCVFARFSREEINRVLKLPSRWLLDEKVPTLAWELTPLTFVLDWFVTSREVLDILSSRLSTWISGLHDDGQGMWLSQVSRAWMGYQVSRYARVNLSLRRPAGWKVVRAGSFNWERRIVDTDTSWTGMGEILGLNFGSEAHVAPQDLGDGWSYLTRYTFEPFLEMLCGLRFSFTEDLIPFSEQFSLYRRGRIDSTYDDLIPGLRLRLTSGKLVSLAALLMTLLPGRPKIMR